MIGRILSIQSHVVSGYVGNKAVTLPLQLLGFDVDPLNTVHYSNHTGFASFDGARVNVDQMRRIRNAMQVNRLTDSYTHVLSGFVGDGDVLVELADWIRSLKQVSGKNRKNVPLYVCDPVLGDNGALYVPEDAVHVYREHLVPIADVVTPNQFECELLTGIAIGDRGDAAAACDVLHERGPEIAIVSSVMRPADQMLTVVGSRRRQGAGETERYAIDVPLLEGYFTGTGDLFSAQTLAWTHRYPNDFRRALETATAAVSAVIQRTHRNIVASDTHDAIGRTRHSELAIVESIAALQHPVAKYRAHSF
jgi:pyridoxine kinase